MPPRDQRNPSFHVIHNISIAGWWLLLRKGDRGSIQFPSMENVFIIIHYWPLMTSRIGINSCDLPSPIITLEVLLMYSTCSWRSKRRRRAPPNSTYRHLRFTPLFRKICRLFLWSIHPTTPGLVGCLLCHTQRRRREIMSTGPSQVQMIFRYLQTDRNGHWKMFNTCNGL